ncbi:MAG TPA: NUDIX hydrolase [Solirubrobacteraceae bacterium]|nr:NUDIX hydrolase [Solirubrobacteraceae bacterium]
MGDQWGSAPYADVPLIPASAGAMIFDRLGRLLILKTTYKKRWSLPGGQIEAGESPWQACHRETLEECGLRVDGGVLVCVDFLPPRPDRLGGLRFLFDCGMLDDEQLSAIELQPEEIEAHRFVPSEEASAFLTRPVGRRVAAAIGARQCIYLEDGRPVRGVR